MMQKDRLSKALHPLVYAYLQKEVLPFLSIKGMVTISEIVPGKKLEYVDVHLSFFSLEGAIDRGKIKENIALLNKEHAFPMKHFIAQSMRNKLKKMPKNIRFYADLHAEKAFALEATIKKITSDRLIE